MKNLARRGRRNVGGSDVIGIRTSRRDLRRVLLIILNAASSNCAFCCLSRSMLEEAVQRDENAGRRNNLPALFRPQLHRTWV